jgi:hypothetical protein
MFPNVRLMVVAVLAAIAGIGCGLGLFATFRINHEPLARLAEGSPPMQLAIDNLARGADARAGIESRLPVTGVAKMISVPVIVPIPEPAVVEQAGADSAVAAESASVQQADADIDATDRSTTASPAVAVQTEPSSVTPDAADAVPPQQDLIATAPDPTPAASPAPASTAEQTAAISPAAPDQEPGVKPTKPSETKPSETKPSETKAAVTKAAVTKAAKPKARASHPAAPARRATKAVRARRIVTTVAAQSAYPYSQPTYSQPTYSQPTYSQPTYSQPTYTWMDGAAQASQPVKRVLIKRSRIAKQRVPLAQSNPSAATAGLSGTQ